jgi:hypothetical protein
MRRVPIAFAFVFALSGCASGSSSSSGSTSSPAATTKAPGSVRAEPSTVALEPTPLQVVQTYIDRFNRGDVAAATATFAPTARFYTPLGGCDPCVGRTLIGLKLAGAIGAETRLSISDPRVVGATLVARAAIRSPKFPPGVDRAVGTFSAVVHNGFIVDSRMEYDRADSQTAVLLRAVGS